jgi:outer membrane protein assembly factor BamB
MQSGDEGTRQQVMIPPVDRESNVTPAVVSGGKLYVASVEGRIYVLTPAE